MESNINLSDAKKYYKHAAIHITVTFKKTIKFLSNLKKNIMTSPIKDVSILDNPKMIGNRKSSIYERHRVFNKNYTSNKLKC